MREQLQFVSHKDGKGKGKLSLGRAQVYGISGQIMNCLSRTGQKFSLQIKTNLLVFALFCFVFIHITGYVHQVFPFCWEEKILKMDLFNNFSFTAEEHDAK